MKLYTKPRPVAAGTVRIGDEVALALNGTTPMVSLQELVDAELSDEVSWGVVHATTVGRMGRVRIGTSRGHVDAQDGDELVIVREYLELDPWSYVRHA